MPRRAGPSLRTPSSRGCYPALVTSEPAVVVIEGVLDWTTRLAPHRVVHRRLDEVGWILKAGRLWCVDPREAVEVAAVLWRVGAVGPRARDREVLEVLRLAKVPCVNSAESLLRGYDRLGMLATLRDAGLPIIVPDVALGRGLARQIAHDAPFVAKVGNFHGGFGKLLVEDRGRWAEWVDVLAVADTYVATERYWPHRRDVRCMVVGEQVWAMQRRGRGWRANVDTLDARMIEPPRELVAWAKQAQRALGAELLGLDALETDEGWIVLEANDVPGLRGFPEPVVEAVAQLLLDRLMTTAR